MSNQAGHSIDIGYNSCNGHGACNFIGNNTVQDDNVVGVKIGDNACTNGELSCDSIGSQKGLNITIESGACHGRYTCQDVGRYVGETISI